MKCQVCKKGRGLEGQECKYCGATIRASAPVPADLAREHVQRHRTELLARRTVMRRRAGRHALAGAAAFGVFAFALVALRFLRLASAEIGGPGEAGRDAEQITVAHIATELLMAFPLMAALGAGAGVVISRRRAGVLGGAAVGAATCCLGAIVLATRTVLAADQPFLEVLYSGVAGLVPGPIVGAIIGHYSGVEEG